MGFFLRPNPKVALPGSAVLYVRPTPPDTQFEPTRRLPPDKSCQKGMLAGKSIRYNVFLSLFVFDYIREGLYKLNPFGMTFVQVGLAS